MTEQIKLFKKENINKDMKKRLDEKWTKYSTVQQRQPVGSLSQCNAIIVKITPKTDLGQGWVQFEFDWARAVGRSEDLRGQVCLLYDNTCCRFFLGGVQD